MDPAEKLASYQDIIDLPAHMTGEIVSGVLHAHPRPAPRHALAASALGADISAPYQFGRGGPGGWWILDEPEIHLGQNILVPDLAGWKKTKMPHLPETDWFETVPDWVCEILSPATERFDRAEKMPLYAQYGVQYCWLVDPVIQTLEAFKLIEGRWVLLSTLDKQKQVSIEPFDATEFNLSDLWSEELE
jgi:Uma2 family endonuclease